MAPVSNTGASFSNALAPISLVRTPIDPSEFNSLSYDAEETIRETAMKTRMHKYAFGPLASVCGWPAGHFGASQGEGLMLWPPLRELGHQFTSECVHTWDSRIPTWRVTYALLHEALGNPRTTKLIGLRRGRGTKWVVGGKPAERKIGWEIEDWYICYILLLLQRLNSDEYRALVDWVRRATVEEQVWIFYHALMFFHFQAKYALWEDQPWYKRLGHFCIGDKGRMLGH